MIGLALECVADDLNARLPRAQPDHLKRVVVSNLVDLHGTPPLETENKVVLGLTALDEEKNILDPRGATGSAGTSARTSDPAFMNLHVMFAATHAHYPTALEALSAVIACLKTKSVFDRQNTPLLPVGIRQLNFNQEKLGYGDLSNLWSYLGANYVPSVNYTIRLVALGQPQVVGVTPAIASVEVAR